MATIAITKGKQHILMNTKPSLVEMARKIRSIINDYLIDNHHKT
jgi:hypothetical protein